MQLYNVHSHKVRLVTGIETISHATCTCATTHPPQQNGPFPSLSPCQERTLRPIAGPRYSCCCCYCRRRRRRHCSPPYIQSAVAIAWSLIPTLWMPWSLNLQSASCALHCCTLRTCAASGTDATACRAATYSLRPAYRNQMGFGSPRPPPAVHPYYPPAPTAAA